jgi:hypothetical protein
MGGQNFVALSERGRAGARAHACGSASFMAGKNTKHMEELT